MTVVRQTCDPAKGHRQNHRCFGEGRTVRCPGNFDVAWTRRLHNGYPLVAAGLEARPRDWSKPGQLVLNHGAWHGKQIVSSWIDLSTTAAKFTPISDGSPSHMSYGFQWWVGRSNCEGCVIDWAAAVGSNSQKIITTELALATTSSAHVRLCEEFQMTAHRTIRLAPGPSSESLQERNAREMSCRR
jgi:CubicO group peptidase (beta-lactamase class C family)